MVYSHQMCYKLQLLIVNPVVTNKGKGVELQTVKNQHIF